MYLERLAEFRGRTQGDRAVLTRMRGLAERLHPLGGFTVFKVPDEERRAVYARLQKSGLVDSLKEELEPGDGSTNVGRQPTHIYILSDRIYTYDTHDRLRPEDQKRVLGLRLQYDREGTSIEVALQMGRDGNTVHAALHSTKKPRSWSFEIPFRHLTPARLRILQGLFQRFARGEPVARKDYQSDHLLVVGSDGQKVERGHIFPW